jgi:hypothetical protein
MDPARRTRRAGSTTLRVHTPLLEDHMKYEQGRVLEALRSVQVFLDKHGEALGEVTRSGARKNVDECVADLQAHAVQQDGGRRKAIGETAHQRELRLALRFAMRPIVEVAAARLRETPQFAALRMPSYRLRGMAMVAAAHAMAEAATAHVAVFTDDGLPADFLEQLRKAADTVSASYDTRRDSQTARMGATRGLKEAERRGRKALRVVDSLVVPALGHDDALLTAWRAARRIQGKPGPVQDADREPANGTPAVTAGNTVPLLPAAPDVADDEKAA